MDKLGIEPTQLLLQVFNFVVMVVLLTKFLYKPILKVLDERRRKIQEGLDFTLKMQEESGKNDKKRDEILNKAKEEARGIIEESKKTAKAVETEIIEKAHKEANVILEKAGKELEMERLEMEKELRDQTVEIAQTWVESILNNVLGAKTQQAIVNKKIQELAKLRK